MRRLDPKYVSAAPPSAAEKQSFAEEAAHDAWFRKKVQDALDDQRTAIPNEQKKTHFGKRRAAANGVTAN